MGLQIWLFLIPIAVLAGPIPVVPPISPSSTGSKDTPEKIELGKKLFFDPRLSSTKKISCSSCHRIEESGASGTDSKRVAEGVFGFHGDRNTPTVWNSGLRSALFLDGRSPSLEDQAKGPILNPLEMGIKDAKTAEKAIADIPGYRKFFQKAFGKTEKDPITIDEIAQAIGAFERTLNTPDSAFDRYQRGDSGAISSRALRGWNTFQRQACVACHGAPTFLHQDYFIRFPTREAREYDRIYGLTKDLGRFKFTKQYQDKNLWRVPSLRNVAITGPYFHNGSVDSLEEAVRIMGKAQLGKTLTQEEVEDIVEFLKSLTGKAPKIVRPVLP